MTAQELHIKFTHLVKTERKITHEILLCIHQIKTTRAYAELGYSSLYAYLTEGLKYSEGAAQRRISAAALLHEIPEVQSKIQEGKINLTQLAKLAVAVKQEQKLTGQKVQTETKKAIIDQLENRNGIETEKLLSQELNYDSKPVQKLAVKDDDFYLTLKLSSTQLEKLKKAQMILSHSVHDGDFASTIEALCDQAIQKAEAPARKAPKVLTEVAKPTAATAVKTKLDNGRVFIPTATRKYVFHRGQYCCDYISSINGHKCGSRFQVQLDHIIPVAKGGGNNPENLRLLCRTHNLSEARRWGLLPHD
jgi:hypothetical protein